MTLYFPRTFVSTSHEVLANPQITRTLLVRGSVSVAPSSELSAHQTETVPETKAGSSAQPSGKVLCTLRHQSLKQTLCSSSKAAAFCHFLNIDSYCAVATRVVRVSTSKGGGSMSVCRGKLDKVIFVVCVIAVGCW